MKDKHESMMKNRAWDLIALNPPRKKPIDYKWVYKVKYKVYGKSTRHRWSQKGSPVERELNMRRYSLLQQRCTPFN
jgi:hypothetical protein